MFLVAALALVIVLPLSWKALPESAAYHRSRGEHERADAVEAKFGVVQEEAGQDDGSEGPRGIRGLFAPGYRFASVMFALSTLATLFAWYGLGTWLPELMQKSGFNLGSSLTFLLALNLGAVAGSLVTAWAGGRFGPVVTGVAAALIAGVSLAGMLLHPSNAVTYVLLMLAGVGTHGTQCLIIAAVANRYPSRLRGTALGWALGVGRIGAVAAPQVGGLLLAAGLGVNSNFIAFAAAAACGGLLLSTCSGPRDRTSSDRALPREQVADGV